MNTQVKGFNLFIEGCDGVGKTTIFRRLLTEGKFLFGVHTDAPYSKESYRLQLTREINSLNNKTGILYDRFFLSECVYAPMLRGYYPEYMRDLEKTMKEHNILVLLMAQADIIKERYDGKILRPEQISECLDRYHVEFMRCNLKHKFIVNSGRLTPNEIIKKLFEYIKKAGFEHSYYLEGEV